MKPRLWTILFLLAAWTACSGNDSGKVSHIEEEANQEPSMKQADLKLEVVMSSKEIPLGDPIPVRIVLRNAGEVPVRVNKRLSMGYEGSLDREVYCKVWREGAVYSDFENWQVDYSRKALAETDFATLAPGDAAEREVDFYEWYHLGETGTYTIKVVYQPDDEGSKGLHAETEVEFRVVD